MKPVGCKKASRGYLIVAGIVHVGLAVGFTDATMAESRAASVGEQNASWLFAQAKGGETQPSAGQAVQSTPGAKTPEAAADEKVFRSPEGKPLPEPEDVLKRKPETKTQGYFGPSYGESLLKLGTEESFVEVERSLIKAQIKSFIPPLLQSAVAGDAYVLPPNTFRVGVHYSFTNISGTRGDIAGASAIDNYDGIRRQTATLSFLYGFDLNQKFLHSFTLGVSIPWSNNSIRGDVQPQGPAGPTIDNNGNAQGLGPISVTLKKKIIDQANFPFGLATVAGVFLPTGSNTGKFGQNGVVPCTPSGTAGCPTGNQVFNRFSPDGRMPAFLQPGWGDAWALMAGGFLTRQLLPGDIPFLAGTPLDRGAIHAGGTYRWNLGTEGFNQGNEADTFVSVVEPVYKDYMSVELTNKWTWWQADQYAGRSSYRKGLIGMLGPSLIFSPDALIRFTATYLSRVTQNELGPSPPYMVNFGMEVTF